MWAFDKMRTDKSRSGLFTGWSLASREASQGGYPVQIYAHLYFILHGFGFWSRWVFKKALNRPIDPIFERSRLQKMFFNYMSMLQKNGIIELDISGMQDCKNWERSIIAPNHPSILDAGFLISLVPSMNCVMKSSLLRNPVASGAVQLGNFIQNDSPMAFMKMCKSELASGSNILIFPEGTRTLEKPVNAFRPTYALVAKAASAPVRTVLIECDSDYFGKNFSHFKPAKCPVRFRVRAGQVFDPDSFSGARQLSEEIENYFRQELANSSL
jgi:1-acyl-sn-glycerol-3-phosphate acyltransferase